MGKRYASPAVIKSFEILRLIADAEDDMGVSEIARALNLGKSTVSAIICALENSKAIIRNPLTKRCTLGFTLSELGHSADSKIGLSELARPFMEELMLEVKESVFLGVLNGEHLTILDIVESRHSLKITSSIGTIVSLFAGATGKIFLANMEENEARRIIDEKGLPRFTANSITDPIQFLDEIRCVREQGYATDYEEYISGARAVAAPIKGFMDQLIALWVVGFKANLSDKKMKIFTKEVKEAADAISLKIKARF